MVAAAGEALSPGKPTLFDSVGECFVVVNQGGTPDDRFDPPSPRAKVAVRRATTAAAVATKSPAPSTQLTFQWSDVAEVDRDWLRKRTEDIEALAYRQACDTVRLGVYLREVRDRLPPRTFGAWHREHTPWEKAQIYRLIAVGEAFAAYISHAAVERFAPTALYLLASPQVPAEARAYAVELAEGKSGTESITREEAKDIIAKHKDARRPLEDLKKSELREYERGRKEVGLDEKSAMEALAVEDMKTKAMAWEAMEKLVTQFSMVHITKIDDTEPYPDERAPASVRVMGGDPGYNGPRSDVGGRLADVVLRLADMEPAKRCLKCTEMKPASRFSRCRSSKDGRNRYCLECERARVKKFDDGKRAKERAVAAGVPPEVN